jgi:hypothetical protein
MKLLAFRFEYQECNYYATVNQKTGCHMIQISQFAPFSLSLNNLDLTSEQASWIKEPAQETVGHNQPRNMKTTGR